MSLLSTEIPLMALVKLCRCTRDHWRRCSHGWYLDHRPAGARVRTNLGVSDWRTARARAAQIEADRLVGKVGTPIAGADMRALALRAIVRDEERGRLRARSADQRRIQAEILHRWFGDVPVSALRVRDVLGFRRDLETTPRKTTGRPASPSYVRGTMALLRAAFGVAQEEGLIEAAPLPAEGSKRPRERAPEHLTIPQVRAVIDAMRDYRNERGPALKAPYGDLAELTLLTGLRLGELLGLRGRDIDLERGLLRVGQTRHRGKYGVGPAKNATSERTMALTPRGLEIAASWWQEGLLFEISQDSCREAMGRALEGLGLDRKGRSWHEFRHAHNTLLDAAGVGVRTAGARMGHGSHFAQTAAYGWAAEVEDVAVIDAAWASHARSPSAGKRGRAGARA